MEEDRESSHRVPRLHAATAAQPGEGVRAPGGFSRLVIQRHIWMSTLANLRDRSAEWRESAAIWSGHVEGDMWRVEAIHLHHELCDDRAGPLSLQLSEVAKFRLYQHLA